METPSLPLEAEKPPPKAAARIVGPILRLLLRSPMHRVVSERLILLTVPDTRTGGTRTFPVGYVEFDERLLVLTEGRWRQGLAPAVPIDVTFKGKARRARAEVIEDDDEVAHLCKRAVDALGLESLEPLGLKVIEHRAPTLGELKTVLSGKAIVRIEINQSQEL